MLMPSFDNIDDYIDYYMNVYQNQLYEPESDVCEEYDDSKLNNNDSELLSDFNIEDF